ncbi:hypothetical protein IJ135_01430, partial [Candidatus Saccharibacteria bacterium]|nr:hypothetical protein [Candidatus Saccharibacteria bacterium]
MPNIIHTIKRGLNRIRLTGPAGKSSPTGAGAAAGVPQLPSSVRYNDFRILSKKTFLLPAYI